MLAVAPAPGRVRLHRSAIGALQVHGRDVVEVGVERAGRNIHENRTYAAGLHEPRGSC